MRREGEMSSEDARAGVEQLLQENGWKVIRTGPRRILATRVDDSQSAEILFKIITGEPVIIEAKGNMPACILMPEDKYFYGVEVQSRFLDGEGSVFARSDRIRLDGGHHESRFIERLYDRA